MSNNKNKKIIVSMTSYPARIKYVSTVIESILNQTMKADAVILWLAEEQFPDKEEQLPPTLKTMIRDKKVILRWCDDLKPHKKYFYAFQEFPHDLIITIDDDIVYSTDMIEKLYRSYQKHPDAVSALRAHLMVYDENAFAPYGNWVKAYDGAVGIPSMQLFSTGEKGILYPVELFDQKLLDRKAIIDNCLYSSDIWLKLMEIACGIPAVLADHTPESKVIISGSQDSALYIRTRPIKDQLLQNSVHWFEERYGQGFVLTRLVNIPESQKLLNNIILSNYYRKRIDKLVQINDSIKNSRSYIIGRVITWPFRKVKALIRRT